MYTRRYFGLGLVMVLIALLYLTVGCVKKKETGKIYLRWSGYGAAGYDEWRLEASREFERLYPNIIVKYEPVHQDYQSKIMTQLASNTAPDVFFCADLQSYVNKGTLKDITAWIKRDKNYFDSFFPSLRDDFNLDGKIYGMHQNVAINVLYYNKEIFDKEGLSYPDKTWTWEDLIKIAIRLTKRDNCGKITQYGIVTPLHEQQLMLYISQNGGRIWNSDGTKCIINSPQSEEALTFWRDLAQKYHVAPTLANMTTGGSEYFGYADLFFHRRAAMYCGGSYEVTHLKIGRIKPFNWGATFMPLAHKGSNRVNIRMYNAMGVWSGSRHPEAAYELMKFMTTPEKIKKLIEFGDSLPLHKSGPDMEYYLQDPVRTEDTRRVMLEALENSKSIYHLMRSPYVDSIEQKRILKKYFEEFNAMQITVNEALRGIETELNALVIH